MSDLSALQKPLRTTVFCFAVMNAWNSSDLASIIPRDPTMATWNWWKQAVGMLKNQPNFKEKCSKMAYLLGQSWLAKNGFIFEKRRICTDEILSQASQAAEEFRRLQRARLNGAG
ncbi:hypothetical protein AAHE18_04G188500 [Arachis hypogaea]